jgi:hypothetical protein
MRGPLPLPPSLAIVHAPRGEWGLDMLVLRGLETRFSLYGAVYLLTAITVPAWFLEYLSLDRFKGWKLGVMGFLSLFGLGVLLWAAAYAVIAIIPYSLGSYDEDGDFQPLRDTLRIGISLIGSLGLAATIEKNALVLVYGPIERKAKRALLDSIRDYRAEPERIEHQAHERLLKELSPGEFERKGWTSKIREEIQQDALRFVRRDKSI